MEFLELRYFVDVSEAGSFSRAAVKLGMTQPALSRQIRKLEQELCTSLFYRHGRGVSLTDSGRKLSEVVKPMLRQLAEVKEDMLERGGGPTGVVTLGVPPSIGNTLVAPLAERFRETCPGATLRVHEAFSSTLLEWIENGRLDLAVLYDARRDRNLLVSPLLMEDFFLIQSAKKSTESTILTMKHLAELTFALPGPENGFRRVVDTAARRAGVSLNVDMELDSISALKQIVAGGSRWCTILPYGAVHQDVQEKRLVARPIKSEEMRAMLVTATPLHRPVTKATRALLRLIQSEIKRCITSKILRGHTDSLSG